MKSTLRPAIMQNFSIGVLLAWEIGCYEAAHNNSRYIETDHIMLGILSIEKVLSNPALLFNCDLDDIIDESDNLFQLLISDNLNITALRRELRNILPQGQGAPYSGIFHRSIECKKMFLVADCIAGGYPTINHLFYSICASRNSYSHKMLAACRIDINNYINNILLPFSRIN